MTRPVSRETIHALLEAVLDKAEGAREWPSQIDGDGGTVTIKSNATGIEIGGGQVAPEPSVPLVQPDRVLVHHFSAYQERSGRSRIALVRVLIRVAGYTVVNINMSEPLARALATGILHELDDRWTRIPGSD